MTAAHEEQMLELDFGRWQNMVANAEDDCLKNLGIGLWMFL
jgi:hypothetical protein